MRAFFARSLIRLSAAIIFLVLARAILLALNLLGYYPERRIAGIFVSIVNSGTIEIAGWALTAVIGIFGLVAWEWFRLGNRLASYLPQPPQELTYLSNRDSELGDAIRRMARSSAWGKWYAAQHLVLAGVPITEEEHLQTACHLVLENLMDGQIDARGRSAGSANYQEIPRTDWRLVALFFLPHPMSLWRMHITSRGTITANRFTGEIQGENMSDPRIVHLLNFDSVIVDAFQFEGVWPERKRREDRARVALLRTARRRRLAAPTIEWLSR